MAAGHAKPLWHGHPWVFARSVAHLDPAADETDDWARVEDEGGRPIGHAFVSERSALRARIVTWGADEPNEQTLWPARVAEAVAWRRRLFPDTQRTNTYRLVHAEGDRLPGLVVDRFADCLVAQFATASMARRRERLAALLLEATGATSLAARPAGFEAEEGIAYDASWRWGPVPERVAVREAGMELWVEPSVGQKTGHYCDQRENRSIVAALASGQRVLDLFAGTGGFGIQALIQGAASVDAIDASERSIARAREHALLAGRADAWTGHVGDVKDHLARLRAAGTTFDLVVVDPPNFFPRSGPDRGARKAYRELNVRALARVAPRGGVLASFSCSARLGGEELLATLVDAAREGHRRFRVLRRLDAGPDHPVIAAGDVGRYLSGWLLAVDPLDAKDVA